MTVHKIIFAKQRGNNGYQVFATLPGYNPNIGDNKDANDPFWQPWLINEDLYECIWTYYNGEGKGDNVKVCEEGDGQSDEE